MNSPIRQSLDALLRQAVASGLVVDYLVRPHLVEIELIQDAPESRLELNPEEARVFLGGLVLGHNQCGA